MSSVTDSSQLREQWLSSLDELIVTVKAWCEPDGWVTRKIDKTMRDSQLGKHSAPALLMQRDTTRVLLDPVGHSAPEAEGVVDLYLLPAYDDIARLVSRNKQWSIFYLFRSRAGNSPRLKGIEEEFLPLTRETLRAILEDMIKNADETI